MKKTSLFGLLFFLAWPVFADEFLERDRIDQTVPANCADPELHRFDPNFKTIFYGIKGSKRMGFTNEYPIDRGEATALWIALEDPARNSRTLSDFGKCHSDIASDLDELIKTSDLRGLTYGKEGDILEGLAAIQLTRVYPLSEFYITGGIAYHEKDSRQHIGELDIVVARRSDCRVIAIGEAKLGSNQINHAREQVERFRRFLKSH